MSVDNLSRLPLTSIAHRCAQETQKLRGHEPFDARYGCELFRRAILEQNEPAWNEVCKCFWPVVSGWLSHHRLIGIWPESIDGLVGDAFARMWRASQADTFVWSGEWQPILSYLRCCAESALMQHARDQQRHQILQSLTQDDESNEPVDELIDPGPQPDEMMIDRVKSQAIWQLVNKHLHDKQERELMYACFVLDLKPQAILAAYRDQKLFRDADEIYLIKARILTRLRNDLHIAYLKEEF